MDRESRHQVLGAEGSASTGHVRGRRSRVRSVGFTLLATVALLGGATACEPDPDPGPKTFLPDIPAPNGDAPLRYRDAVFSTVTKTSNIVWGSAPDRSGNPVELKLDMYAPTGDTATSRPVVVLAHSGGCKIGSKTNAVSVDLANRFAKKGYVAISIDYRLLAIQDCGTLGGLISDASGCRYATMAATSDGQAAVRWVRANAATYGMDPTRVAMMGDSAGALMSTLTAMLADVPTDFNDPKSIEIMAGAPVNVGNLGYPSNVQAWSSISGGLPPTDTPGLGDRLKVAITPPSPGYIFSSPTDNQTPYQWSVDVRDQLVIARRLVAFKEVTGGHVPYTTHKELFNSQTSNLFYYVMNLAAAPQ